MSEIGLLPQKGNVLDDYMCIIMDHLENIAWGGGFFYFIDKI